MAGVKGVGMRGLEGAERVEGAEGDAKWGFRKWYGESPLQLLLMLGSFALTLYAGLRLLEGDAFGIAVWFLGAAVLHDLVLLPLYAFADRCLQAVLRLRPRYGVPAPEPREAASPSHSPSVPGPTPPPAPGPAPAPAPAPAPGINFIRVPAFVSGVLLLVWVPLIGGWADRFETHTGQPGGSFWERWLLITAVLFATSALLFLARSWRLNRGSRR